MDAPLVSVVIATWNRKADVLETIQSVYDQDYQPVEIVVVDNGSTDNTVESVRAAYPDVTLVALHENAGATRGRNAGIKAARGEIVFLLDSDASMGVDSISSVVKKFQEAPAVGAIACKVVNFYTRQLDRTAGWVFSERVKPRQDEEFPAFRVSECGSAFRKEVLDRIGGFWEYIFFNREGEELCLRVWDAGYSVLYFPTSKVYHRVSPSRRIEGGMREYTDVHYMLAIYLARYTWWMILIFLPLRLAVSFFKGLRKKQLGYVLRALLRVARDLPLLLRERRPISNATGRIYMQLQRDHGALSWDLRSWLKYKASMPAEPATGK